MIEFFKFALSGLWNFLGCYLLLKLIFEGSVAILGLILTIITKK